MMSSIINSISNHLQHHDHPNQQIIRVLFSQLFLLLEICPINSPLSVLTSWTSFTNMTIVCSFRSSKKPESRTAGRGVQHELSGLELSPSYQQSVVESQLHNPALSVMAKMKMIFFLIPKIFLGAYNLVSLGRYKKLPCID